MQEAFRHRLAPVFNQDTNDADAKTVHQDGNGYGGEKYDGTLPECGMKEIADDKAKRHQREKITQSTAGLNDLQFVCTKINDVAFQEYAYTKKTDYPDTEL